MTWWKFIYDNWLEEGDLKLLVYLQKIQRYLGQRQRTEQEVLNLHSQIEGLLELKYMGDYINIDMGKPGNLQLTLNIMQPYPLLKSIPDNNNLDGLIDFFSNGDNVRIKPQTTEELFCHPCWILWTRLFNEDNREALWAYRKQFLYYMDLKDYAGAARVYQHAVQIRERTESLPLLCPHILSKVMYCKLDYKARIEIETPDVGQYKK
jgi:hypothetical protein